MAIRDIEHFMTALIDEFPQLQEKKFKVETFVKYYDGRYGLGTEEIVEVEREDNDD